MPRLESITVSHSILSLTCDRNKAVLQATFSAACAARRLLPSGCGSAGAGVAPAAPRGRGTAGLGLLCSQTPHRHPRLLPHVLQPSSLEQERAFALFIPHRQ